MFENERDGIIMEWEKLNVDEFSNAIDESKGVILIPIGCLEKHGSHMPIGTDILIAREIAIRASRIENVMDFPFIPFGIVGEVKHKLGTISLTSNLIYNMLDELCDEVVRNGFNKIVFIDGHGGNHNFLKYFMQSRLEKPHPYITYYFDVGFKDSKFWQEYQQEFGRVYESGHACEFETSSLLEIDQTLIQMNKIIPEETKALHRLDKLNEVGLYTGISWYADYPHQIAGNPSNASIERGKWINERNVIRLVAAIKTIKETDIDISLLNEYYEKHNNPEK